MNSCLINKSFSGLGADPYASSNQQYLNEIASIDRRLSDIEAQLQSSGLSEETRQGMLSEKINLLARKASIQRWLNLSSQQKSKTNPNTFLQQYQSAYNGVLQKLKDQYDSSGDILSDLTNMNIAGLPLWGIVLVVGAGIYMFTQYNKKKK